MSHRGQPKPALGNLFSILFMSAGVSRHAAAAGGGGVAITDRNKKQAALTHPTRGDADGSSLSVCPSAWLEAVLELWFCLGSFGLRC